MDPRYWVETQIPKWVDSCITAKGYQETVHYLVEDGQVKPVDYNTTGIVQDSTSWSGGLHQFLQIKHGLKMTSETVTTNFISNMAMFQKYSKSYTVVGELAGPSEFKSKAMERFSFQECNIVGLTGTLGSSHTRRMLRDLYNVNCVNLPQAHHLQYVQYKDNLVQSRNEWLSEIVHAADSEVMRDRGVLIICETIRDALEVSEELKSSLPKAKTKLYTKNNAGQEGEIERIQPGEVFIATNLAGRGTDIKTDGIEEFGGLHVILTFLAMNVRVEEQAFGRTARQGRLGSGQLICISVETSGADIRKQRDAQQEAQLQEFVGNDLPLLKAKDKCFTGFCNFLNNARKYLREEHADESAWTQFKGFLGCDSDSPPTTIELNVIQAIEERWAMFLGIQLEGNKIPLTKAWGYYKFFEQRINLDMKQGASKVIRSPFYHISIGNDFLLKDCKTTNYIQEAMEAFNNAIRFDSNFATAAYVGKGFCYLRGTRNLIRADTHEDNCRTKAMACFNVALSQIQQELGNISSSQSLVQSDSSTGMTTDLFEQITLKQNALNNYSNCIEKAVQVAKGSLRGINITAIDATQKKEFVPHMSKSFNYTDNTVDSCSNVISHLAKTHNTFSLEFNDLTVSQDSGAKDQAKNTIENCKGLCTSVDILCKETHGVDSLLQVISPDKYGNELSRAAALEMLKAWKETLSMKEKAKEMIKKKANINIEIIGDHNVSRKTVTDLTFDKAIKQIEDLSESALVNLRYKSGNSDIHNVMKDVELTIELIACNQTKILQTLCLLSNTTVDLQVQSSNLEGFMENLSSVELQNKEITLLKCSPDSSGWTSIIVPSPEGHWNKEEFENGEAFFKDLEISEAMDIANICEDKDSFSLTINHLSKTGFFSSFEMLKENKQIFSKLKMAFKNVHKRKYADIISCLRNKLTHLKFSIVLNELSTENAERALKKADMGMEPIQESKQTFLSDSFCNEWLPVTELWEFQLRGIYIMCEFNEKSPIPWFSIGCVLALAAIQLAIGGILVCTGFGASVGMGLITEGAADIFTAYRAYSNREFSWGSYATQKAVSLVIAAVSAGLGKLKDAATGVKAIAESVTREAGERALTTVMAEGGKKAAIQLTKSNLRSLAVKQIGVSVGEAAAREGINSLVTMGSQLVMSNYKSDVVRSVESKVRGQFYTNVDLRKYLGLLWALDKLSQSKNLDSKIKTAVQETLNPKSATFTALWNSVGLPLLQGVLSSSKQVGGIASIGFRIAGILNGMTEIVFVIEKVMEAIVKKLEAENATDIIQILVHRLKMNPVEAQRTEMSFSHATENDLAYFRFEVSSQENKTVSEYFKKLNTTQLDFKIEKMDMTIKWMSDTLSEHILKVADSQIRAPITTFITSKAVSQVSKFVQSNFIISSEHNTDDLKDKKNITVSQQIDAQAKQYMIQYQQVEISRKIANAQDKPEGEKIPQDVTEKINKTIQGAPAGINEMSTLAKLEGKQLVILTDKDSIPQGNSSPDKIVVLYTPGTKESEGVGHYSLVDSETGRVVPIDSTNMDCGYAIFAHLNPGTTPAEMRLKVAYFMHEHPTTFSSVIQNEAWIQNRFPNDANKYLLVGGTEKDKAENRTRKVVGGSEDEQDKKRRKTKKSKESDAAKLKGEEERKRIKDGIIKQSVKESTDFKNIAGEAVTLTTKSMSHIPPKATSEGGKNHNFTVLASECKEAEANTRSETSNKVFSSRNHIDNQVHGGENVQQNLSVGHRSMNTVESSGPEKIFKIVKNKIHEGIEKGELHEDTEIVHKYHVDYPEQSTKDGKLRLAESVIHSYGVNNPKAQAILDKEFRENNLYLKKVGTVDGVTFTDYEIKLKMDDRTGKAKAVPVNERSDNERYLTTESEGCFSPTEHLPSISGDHSIETEKVHIFKEPKAPKVMFSSPSEGIGRILSESDDYVADDEHPSSVSDGYPTLTED